MHAAASSQPARILLDLTADLRLSLHTLPGFSRAPRKLVLSHLGWRSDDTKTFEKDRGGKGDHTHTHAHCSLFSKVASFLL
jgi:hypothetical protein